MRNAKKLLSVLLALTLALGTAAAGVGGLPMRSSAAGTGKAIVLVTGGAADFIKGAQQSSVWFGNYMQSSADSKEPVKWRVLSNADGKLFLLADQNLDVVQYYEHETSITWENSTVRSWLNGDFCSAAFSDAEHAAIPEDTVVNDNNPYYGTAGGNDTTDQVFLLSIAEATTAAYGFPEGYDSADTRKATNTAFVSAGGHTGTNGMYANGAADYWWLRSPGDSSNCAAFVTNYGFVADGGNHVDDDNIAVRPALNIHLNAVLFTSAPAGGKAGSGLTAVSDYDGAEWKLTLLDESRSDFTASACRLGDKWVITYSGATTGENEKISAMIVNGSGEVTYYGVLGDAQTGTNTVTLNAAGKLNEGDKLYVFNEQCNGDKKTDFASPLVEITDAPVFYEIPKCDLATLNDGDYWFDLHKLLEDEGYRCSEDIFTDLQLFSYFYVSADGSTALIKKNVDDFYEEHHFEYLTYTAGDARFAYLKQHVTPTCGAVAFTEEFEREPTGWTFVDSDGDGHGWNHNICDYSVFDTRQSMHSGNGILYSESYLNHSGPLTPDNWAITPAIVVPEEAATLTFWVTGQDSWDFAEHYGVYVYEAADPAAPALPAGKPADYMKTKLMEQTNDSPNAYVENTVDLSDYAGKTVFLAFRHFDCTNQYHLNLDSVTVKGINHTYGDTGADRYTCTVCGTMNEARKAACAGAPDMTVSAPTVTYGSNAVITATLPSDATGTVRFTLTSEKDGTTIGPFNADVSDGTAQISQKLGADTYAVSAIYSGDGDLYLTKTAGASLTVNPADPVITMTSEPTNEAGTEARVTITIPADAKGDVLLKMTAPSGKINTVAMAASFFENGVRTMDVPADYPFFFTETGEYQFVASFSNDPSDPDGTNYNNAPDAATLTFELGCNHVWATPTWVWDDNDLSQVTYSTTCTLGCETKASDKVVPTKGTRVEATLNDDAYTTYTAEVTLGTQTFSDEHKVYEPGTMQAAREQAFNEYKAQIITGIEGKALEGDSNAAAQLIEDAAAAVEGVTYDRSQGLEENKAAVDNAANLPALENALTDQRAADAVETAINEIGQVEYTDESKGKIDAARAAYDALTDTQKALVPDEAKQALTDAQAAYQLLEDKAEFEAYKDAAKDAADALGKADDSAKTAALIEAAKKAIDDVPYNQSISLDANKAAVDAAANFDALDEALADQRAADAVEAKINAIGQIALNDECKARVEDAKAAYDALTDAQKALLPLNAQYALFDAVAAFQQMDDEKAFAYYKEVVKGIADMFAEEGDSEKATALIEAAKQAVDELAYDKSLTRDENLDAIEAAADLKGLGDKLDDQRAADAAENAINAIGDVALTDECKGKIDAARAAYDALTDAQKALVPDEAKQALTDAEQEYADRAAFEEYKEEKKTALDALAKEGDSAAAQQIIEDAKTQIDALEYDDAKPLADNKAAADAIVANAEKALETQRTADCPLCGKGHENGFFDKLLGVIHRALYYVNLYGRIAVFYFFQMIMRF